MILPKKISWEPNEGRQREALCRNEDEILYGGARGGGKTDAGLAWLIELSYIENPLYRALVIRKNADDLFDWTERARSFYRPLRGVVTGKPATIRFPSGAVIRLGHLKDENAYGKYIGHEYHKILVEELTQIPREDDFLKLLSTNRSTVDGLKAQGFFTTNPGNIGHAWVKHRYVDVAKNKTYIDPISRKSRIFIPSRVKDNPILMEKDPTYYGFLAALTDPVLKAMWLEGNWNVQPGIYWDKWDERRHVVQDFVLPSQWKKYRCIDWGYVKPSYCGWWAVDYHNVHYKYRELYVVGWTPTNFAKRVLEITNEKIIATLGDPKTLWAPQQYGVGKDNDMETRETISDIFARNGLYCTKANNARVTGWTKMRDMMYWDENLDSRLFPKFRVFASCNKTRELYPAMIRDKKNLEDMDTDQEDHICDGDRYLFMHTVKTKEKEGYRGWHDNSLDNIEGEQEDSTPWGLNT